MALIGWNPGDEREIFSKEELIKEFSLERIQKSAGIFNVERLDWYNKEYIKKLSPKDLEIRVSDELGTQDEIFIKKSHQLSLIALTNFLILKNKERRVVFFFNEPEYAKEMLLWKKDPDMEKPKNTCKKLSSW